MSDDTTVRARAFAATSALITALAAAGARHHDLNVKNVLLRERVPGALEAVVLDVDRVTFDGGTAARLRQHNLARLVRSARKWRDRWGARVTDEELASLGTTAG
jgi:hypothetical protein